MNRKALGKGLEALIPDTRDEVPGGTTVQMLAPGEVESNPEQPRTRFDGEGLRELAASMKVHGVVQPILVRAMPGGGYRLVAGERRLRAARMAGLPAVPAIVREVPDNEALELALVENLQREDLNPIDEARGYEALMEIGELGQADVAERVGKDRSTVANAVRLLELEDEIQQMLSGGVLTAGHGRALLSLGTPEERRRLADRAVRRGLSVREVEALVRARTKRKRTVRERRSEDPVVRSWEERLQRIFGTLVRIEQLGNEGSVRIEYYSDEERDRILELLVSLERGSQQ
jgi:ParB family chromosome partitioning protein